MTDTFDPALDLKIERKLNASPELVWECWTNPKHFKHWWCPRPWQTPEVVIDLRPGGRFFTRMTGPEGGESVNEGCYLEIVPERKLVWTSCLSEDYRPHLSTWMPFTGILMISEDGAGTAYTAIARHGDPKTHKQHEEMGFHEGWGTVADQLEEYAQELKK